MTLEAGTRVGPYEVIALLGSGGMGEVFRARDARLKRDVALKVLRPSAVGDADRLPRFEREAQVLASLNHPAIAQVFGVEIHGDAPVIVMELVEGPTLAERLTRGALPIDDALSVAMQLCDGLEAAHERGIIHRDLKPANIKVRGDGTIKILDFGIARVMESEVAADPANSPTILRGNTDLGVLLGTAAYMSPEQARGRPVDKRADIWAFGCLLYEMLTGSPAFGGESTTDTLADIVRKDPDWSRLPSRLPLRIGELLHRCLQKNPKDRLRDIADARFEIAHALDARPAAAAASPRAEATPSRSLLIGAVAFVAGAAAAAGLTLLVGAARSRPAENAAPVRAVIPLPPDTTVALNRGSDVALSPDGHTLAFAGHSKSKTQLYLRSLDRLESQPIAGTDEAANPFFSPDGRWVGFFAGGKLKKISFDGGAPVAVADAGAPRGEAWGDKDSIYLTPNNNSGIMRVSAFGGKPEPVTTLKTGELSHRWPRLLPDDSAILFTIWNDSGFEPSRIAAQAIAGGAPKIVIEAGGGYARYIRDPLASGRRGYLLYARTEGLLAAPFDESRLAVTGQSVPVVDGVVTNLSGGAHFDISPSGTLAYVTGTLSEMDRQLVWVTADKKVTPLLSATGISRNWMLSADETRVVRSNSTGGPVREIWIENLAARTTTRMSNSTDTFNPIWSSDSKWIAYAKGVPNSNIYRRPSDGRDFEQRLTSGPRPQLPVSFSPDGKWLAYDEFDPITNADIWVVPVSDPTPGAAGQVAAPAARPFVKTNFVEGWPRFSPDGKWVVYQSNESGRYEVYVRSFPDGERTARISTDGGISPVWSASGHEIYFLDMKNRVLVTSVTAAPDFQASTLRAVFDAVGYENVFTVSADGQRFLMMPLVGGDHAPTQINLVFNFLSELRQRVR